VTLEDVKQAYLAKAVAAHPDRGGSPEAFIQLQQAYEEANEYVKLKGSRLEWLASKVEAYAEQQQVVSAVVDRGGTVDIEETDWLRRQFGEDFGHLADKLVSITLHGPSADDALAVLVGYRAQSIKDLVAIDFAGGSITDEGLQQLKSLHWLRRLDLRGTKVGRLGLEAFRWFEHLEFLGLPRKAVGLFGRMSIPIGRKLVVGDGPTDG